MFSINLSTYMYYIMYVHYMYTIDNGVAFGDEGLPTTKATCFETKHG